MKKCHLLPIILFCVAACHQPDTQAQESTDSAPVTENNTPSRQGASSIVNITEPCVIFCTPDSLKIEAMEKADTDETFYTLADDNLNYMSTDRELLESKGMKIIDVTNHNTLQFKLADGTTKQLNMDDPKYGWEIFLFDGKHAPFRADITDIPASLNAYNME
jgi:hypothetical protein